jgi:hypothetical protein
MGADIFTRQSGFHRFRSTYCSYSERRVSRQKSGHVWALLDAGLQAVGGGFCRSPLVVVCITHFPGINSIWPFLTVQRKAYMFQDTLLKRPCEIPVWIMRHKQQPTGRRKIPHPLVVMPGFDDFRHGPTTRVWSRSLSVASVFVYFDKYCKVFTFTVTTCTKLVNL